MSIPPRPLAYERHTRRSMDIRPGFRIRILALFWKLLEIRRFLLRCIHRSLAYITDHDMLRTHQTASGRVLSAQPFSRWFGFGAHVASNREPILEEQFPLPSSLHEGSRLNLPLRNRLMVAKAAI